MSRVPSLIIHRLYILALGVKSPTCIQSGSQPAKHATLRRTHLKGWLRRRLAPGEIEYGLRRPALSRFRTRQIGIPGDRSGMCLVGFCTPFGCTMNLATRGLVMDHDGDAPSHRHWPRRRCVLCLTPSGVFGDDSPPGSSVVITLGKHSQASGDGTAVTLTGPFPPARPSTPKKTSRDKTATPPPTPPAPAAAPPPSAVTPPPPAPAAVAPAQPRRVTVQKKKPRQTVRGGPSRRVAVPQSARGGSSTTLRTSGYLLRQGQVSRGCRLCDLGYEARGFFAVDFRGCRPRGTVHRVLRSSFLLLGLGHSSIPPPRRDERRLDASTASSSEGVRCAVQRHEALAKVAST